MYTVPKEETRLTDSRFDITLVLEEAKIDLEKLPDDDKVKDEGIKVEKHEEQAKESAEKETNIVNHHEDINPASEDIIDKETSQEDFESDNKVSKDASIEAEVDNKSMERSSTINPAVGDHKDVNLNCEDMSEGTN